MLSILPQQSGFPLSDMLRSPESPVGNQSARGLFEEFLREARIGAESAAAVPRGNREAAGEETGADPETPAEAAALAPGLLIPAASAPSTGAAVSPDSGAADAGGGDDRVKVDREEAVFLSGVSPGRDEKPVSTGERLRKSAPEVDRAGGEGPGAADKDGAEGIAASSGAAETGADGSRVFRENRSSPGLADGRTPGSVAGKADGKVAGSATDNAAGKAAGSVPEDNTAGPEEGRLKDSRPGAGRTAGGGPVDNRSMNGGPGAGLEETAAGEAAVSEADLEGAALERAAGERTALEKAALEAAEQAPGGDDSPFSAEFFAAAARRAERPEPENPFRSRGLEWNIVRTGGREVSARIQDEGPEKTEKAGGDRRTGRKRVTLELQDYRTSTPEKGAPLSPSSEAELHPETSRNSLFADLEPGGVMEKTAGNSGARAVGGFEELLARELRQNLNGDIVRHAQVILRDGGEGLIRLSLKPESLGNVKIRLELTENKITGRIIVESGEALRAFEREIASLEQAFRDSGYESAELGAFLSQDGGQPGDSPGEDKPFYSPRLAADRAASRYDEVWERTDTALSGDSEGDLLPGNRRISINMLV